MSAPPTTNWFELIAHLPADSHLTLHNAIWGDYEELLAQVGGAAGLRISYNDRTLQIMTVSAEHENYVEFISGLIRLLSVALRINIRFFGSTTIRSQKHGKGSEPDSCFYVQSASLIGNRMHLGFTVDPPPDVAVEVDIHHESGNKFPIYVALGVPEIWRYDGQELIIYHLEQGRYVRGEESRALPMLSSHMLSDSLRRLREEGELQALLVFDEWVRHHHT